VDVQLLPIDQIKPYAKNPRINDGAIAAVARSIEEFGFRQPIVVDENIEIIVGHTRWKAAKFLQYQEVPVHIARGLTEAQIKAYRIADNQTAQIAGWDYDLLPAEILDLKDMGFNVDLLGFSGEDLSRILDKATDGQTDPDDVPLPPDAATTQPGDLWALGRHRLLCGDSSKPEDLDRLLGGATIQLVNTDPPYNVKVEPASSGSSHGGKPSWRSMEGKRAGGVLPKAKGPKKKLQLQAKSRSLANDFVSDEAFDRLLLAWFGNIARALDPGRSFYIWGGYANIVNYPPAIKASQLKFAQCIIWVKGHPVLTRKDFMCDHEWCFYGWREGAGHKFFGPNNVTDVWAVKKINPQSMIHLTEKPVELAARAIQYSSLMNENVLDLFGGSGSTLIACEQNNRNAFLMELDPAYCDVIVERWEKFTGQKAGRV
jgi:DNA modification methylase